ncbi:MAG: GAF domain-containing protein [Clostridia bacterium]|nr:GAF domain-containing protein [Clostridia bacterium]
MTDYALLTAQLRAYAETDGWYLPLLSNASALLWDALPSINWAGFYVLRGGRLVLGPFQGKVACIHIKPGKGVCGTALAKDETQLVPNVHEFPGHIACDSASNSEIVVPIHAGGEVVAVLDIDSPLLNRFTEADREGLEAFAKAIEETIQFDF